MRKHSINKDAAKEHSNNSWRRGRCKVDEANMKVYEAEECGSAVKCPICKEKLEGGGGGEERYYIRMLKSTYNSQR